MKHALILQGGYNLVQNNLKVAKKSDLFYFLGTQTQGFKSNYI